MAVIYKYLLHPQALQVIKMPFMAKILHVHQQNNTPCLWVQINEDEIGVEDRKFVIIATGESFTPVENNIRLDYLGTVHIHDGTFVWHVFEEVKVSTL